MYKKITLAVLGTALLASPIFTSADTLSDIQAQIQNLLTQIAALQAQLGTTPPTSTPTYPASQGNNCPQLVRALSLGARGQDVLELQQFLIAQNLLNTDLATGYFGPLTEAGVQRWQTSHGIVSSGDAASTGWGTVGPRTRSMIALNCNIANPTPTPASCPIAPPPSTICVAGWQATTDSSGCTISYRCSIPLQPTPSQNACTAIGFIQPTASCSGTWQPTRNSAGCQNGWQCVPGASSGSFSASPTSGAAPLSVVFNIPSTPGQNKTLYFGDGLSDVTGCQTTAAWTTTHTYTASRTYYPYLATPCTTSGTTYSLGDATITVGSMTNTTSIAVSESPSSVTYGQNLSVSWASQNSPTDSAVALYLVNVSGVSQGVIGAGKPASSGMTWTVPSSNAGCADCPTLQSPPPAGTYAIVADLYTPSSAWISGYPPPNPTYPTFLVTATSSAFAITAP